MRKIVLGLVVVGLFLMPMVAQAQTTDPVSEEISQRQNKKLSIVMMPQNPSDIKSHAQAVSLLQDNNIHLTHVSKPWRKGPSFAGVFLKEARKKGIEVTFNYEIVYSSVRGEMPIRFRKWDDPGLIAKYSKFVINDLKKYKGMVNHIIIGNEVDIYFASNPRELPAFKTFYKKVYYKVKAAHPDIDIGITFAYHHMKKTNNFLAYNELSPLADYDVFTLYVYSPGFLFNKEPKKIYDYLKEIEGLTDPRPFALQEVGWNSYSGIEGSEEG
ncbi:hypothetical protein ACFL2Y_02480 [Candidatus Omnitrophota bacterium]